MAKSDEEIVRLFLERNGQAIAGVQEKYGAYCRSIALRILGNEADAEECVNDAWLKAWESIPPNRPVHLKSYLGRITRNLSFNLYEKERTAKRGGGAVEAVLEELEECVPGGSDPEAECVYRELTEEINAFLALLPKEKRMMFVSRYWYADSIPEIAKRFGISENAVSVRLNRLRKSLRAHLSERGFEP